jgi:hypothetical protein
MKPETLLCQFADETGWHPEGTWHGIEGWRGKNNLAGISPGGQIGDYDTLDDFANAYVHVIEQDAYGFPAVLAETDIVRQCIDLGRSQWAGSKYDSDNTGRPGVDLTTIYQNYSQMIEDALNEARAAQTTPAPVQEEAAAPAPAPSAPAETPADPNKGIEDALNNALHALGECWAIDEAGRDFYHGWAMQIRALATVRGIQNVTTGA